MKPMTYADWSRKVCFEGFTKGCALLGLNPADMDDLSEPRDSRVVGFAIYPGNAWIAMTSGCAYVVDIMGDQFSTRTLDAAASRLYLDFVVSEVFAPDRWTLDQLGDLYTAFRGHYDLPESSADDLLAYLCEKPQHERGADEQARINWLLWFVKAWEAAEDREDAA